MPQRINAKQKRFLLAACLLIGTMRLQAQDDKAMYEKIDALVKQMTVEEKLGMIHASSSFANAGVPRLNIPRFVTSDGPHGVRMEHGDDWTNDDKGNDSATYLPVGVALASTWNPKLGYAFGAVLGSEANYRGKDVILGPGINIMRTPLNGRNFEYESEDPFLISKMVVGYIKGVQDQGVAACVKHFVANNQEIRRSGINVIMSERALRELYLPGFKAAVTEAKSLTIMGAYNRFRGQYCTYNDYLVNQILRKEWGFKGLMISDWGAIHSTMEALYFGADLEMGTDLDMMPNPNYNKFFFGDPLLAEIKKGTVDMKWVDEKVRRVLYVQMKTNAFGGRKPGSFSTAAHQQTALKIAEEAMVLLKNDGAVLPLSKKIKSVAVIGGNADRLQSEGGGSSQVRTPYEITPLKGIQQLLGTKVKINYAEGFKVVKNSKADPALIAEAVNAAKQSDAVIIVGGWVHGYDYNKWSDNAYDAEGFDKPDMDMPFGQNELIKAVLAVKPNAVIVLMGGGPIDISAWEASSKAIVQAWYPGMEGGTALARVLFGDVNPSGKLPVTFPKHLNESPAHVFGDYPGDSITVQYKEDLFVGYRYNDTYKVDPQFAFGHGLSYTNFGYSNLNIVKGNNSATVSFTVTNNGKTAGAEVAQLYVKDVESTLRRPEKELKGFDKVWLAPGESKTVTIELTKDAFQYYNDLTHDWVLEPGEFTILVGGSSRDIKLNGSINL